jgi:hypothetical protein
MTGSCTGIRFYEEVQDKSVGLSPDCRVRVVTKVVPSLFTSGTEYWEQFASAHSFLQRKLQPGMKSYTETDIPKY